VDKDTTKEETGGLVKMDKLELLITAGTGIVVGFAFGYLFAFILQSQRAIEKAKKEMDNFWLKCEIKRELIKELKKENDL